MSLLLLLRPRRPKRNAGHAEIAVTEAIGRGRVVVPARIAAAYLPAPRVIRGAGSAAMEATMALGTGRLIVHEDELLVALLMSAA